MPSFETVNGAAIDYMHVLEGVGKKLLKLWLSAIRNPYSIKANFELVDERLCSIKPTDDISRTPRSLHLVKFWKGKKITS